MIRCPTKMRIWKDTCPVKEEKLFPALHIICIFDVWWLHSSCPWFERKRTIFMWLITSWRQVLLKRFSTWSSEPAIQGETTCVSSSIFDSPHGSHRKEVRPLSLRSIVWCSNCSKNSHNVKWQVGLCIFTWNKKRLWGSLSLKPRSTTDSSSDQKSWIHS